MSPTSDDDRFDELMAQAARDYNEPGNVPREAMWARIAEARQAARQEATQAPHDAPHDAPLVAPLSVGPNHLTPSLRASRHAGWFWPGIGIAAALVLSTGIVIGRRMERSSPATPVAKVAVKPAPDTPNTPNSAANERRPAATSVAQTSTRTPSATTSSDTLIGKLRDETRKTDLQARQLASAAPTTNDPMRDNVAYQLVVMRHLAGAEAMITSFQSSAPRGEQDAAMASWSRELLGTTRTLEASPVAKDPVMKRLLDDLDLVITQIVQYTARGTYDPDELQLIDQSIQRRSVITKLRSTLPARPMPAGL